MEPLRTLDTALFRWINRDWAEPWLDPVMRFLSGNPFFGPALAIVLLATAWRGGRRGILCVAMLGVALAIANGIVVNPVKHWAARGRPYAVLEDVILRVGRGNPSGSMPSAHALNCALMAAVGGWYFRRSLGITAPIAAAVGVSRIYNELYFPTDVLVGAGLGVATAWVAIRGSDWAWRRWAPRCCPNWVRRVPSLADPNRPEPVLAADPETALPERPESDRDPTDPGRRSGT